MKQIQYVRKISFQRIYRCVRGEGRETDYVKGCLRPFTGHAVILAFSP